VVGVSKFSFEVSYKKNNRTINPWYDKESKIARKSNRDDSNESLKLNKINTYKALIKRKKRYYIDKRKDQLSQLYNLDPKKLWRQILKCNTKENNRIPLRDWDSYLKSIYEFPNAMDTIPIVFTKE
jgi:DNA helicase HerA-like ATPase